MHAVDRPFVDGAEGPSLDRCMPRDDHPNLLILATLSELEQPMLVATMQKAMMLLSSTGLSGAGMPNC